MEEFTLSIVIPCFNEENTLETCIERIRNAFESVADTSLDLIIVDDYSSDNSLQIARRLANDYPEITVQNHDRNRGKGAALRTGFAAATGDFVAIQDADLEYDPHDLIRLLDPLKRDLADVVYGSRFLGSGMHRVLYFWHSMGNKFLTLVSNMLTDLNLTDMETCYKVFRRDVIQNMELKEDRFGFEPEVTANIAEARLRVIEMSVSYFGRTYEEGKKIGVRDGFRALYCILRYNAHRAPSAIQFFIYLFIGTTAALFNLALFALLLTFQCPLEISAAIAFILAAALNYLICVNILFRRNAQWSSPVEITIYIAVVAFNCLADVMITRGLVELGTYAILAKAIASGLGLILNFMGRKFLVFSERARGPWRRQTSSTNMEDQPS